MDNQEIFFDTHGALQRQKLAQQQAEQNALLGELAGEQRRKKRLPKCPECKTPMEIGATICTGCKEHMVWCDLSKETRLGNVRTVRQWLPALFKSKRSELEASRNQIRNDIKSTVKSVVKAEQASRKLLEFRKQNRGYFKILDTALQKYEGSQPKSDSFERGLPKFFHETDWAEIVGMLFATFLLGGIGLFFSLFGYIGYYSSIANQNGEERTMIFLGICGLPCVLGAVFVGPVRLMKILKIRRCGYRLMSRGIATILKPVSAVVNRLQTLRQFVLSAMTSVDDMTVIRTVAAQNSIQLPAHSETETRYARLIDALTSSESKLGGLNWKGNMRSYQSWPTQIRNCLHTLQAIEPELVADTALMRGVEEHTVYYIKRGTTRKGPLSVEKLQSLMKAKKLKPSDEVSRSPEGPWMLISQSSLTDGT